MFISSSFEDFSLVICAPNIFPLPAARFLADVLAKSDLGFALFHTQSVSFLLLLHQNMTYFPTCLLRYALSFAVHGDMMVSEGEMYVCLPLFPVSHLLFFLLIEDGRKG